MNTIRLAIYNAIRGMGFKPLTAYKLAIKDIL